MDKYEVKDSRRIEELGTDAVLYRHRKSGARVLTMKNADPNRVFCIAFRTPAADSTGVAHITEHSVLCGSKRFPLKDPFVELVKGSLNTFLNAMTYPDKTVYPIASTNEKDFENLMNVYMDAVLYPNCIRDERTFLQEGWHYELTEAQGPLTLNGVVYNEMKGAFSNPESVLERYTMHALFPDTTYGNESGGDPEEIPNLSYEAFCAFHKRYYHPSNSYIILYGDLDMEEKLAWLDREYLCDFDSIDPDSEIQVQKPFRKPKREEISFAVGDNEPLRKNTYLSCSMVLGDRLSAKEGMAFSVLDYALLSAPGAPLKQAILEAGIGEDVYGGFEEGIRQPYFSIVAKGADKKDEKRFRQLIHDTLLKLSEEGLDRKTLLSAINHDEFQYREADYGRTPKGLVYALTALDSWLYDGEPWENLLCEAIYRELREELDKGYFEKLIRRSLLDNPHAAMLVVKPERGLTEKKAQALADRLAGILGAMSSAEKRAMIENTAALKAYQDEPSTESQLQTLPLLALEDIGKKASGYHFTEGEKNGVRTLYTELASRGILYLRLNFNTACLTEEELSYAGLLKTVLAYMDTEKHSFQDLSSEIYLETGGINFDMTAYPDLEKYNHYTGVFSVDLKLLYNQIPTGLSLLTEILKTTRFGDVKRMTEILNEARSRERMRIDGAAHTYAINRGTSYFSGTGRYQDLCGGISYYRFVEQQAQTYAAAPEKLTEKLTAVAEKLFRLDNLLLSAGAEAEGFRALEAALPVWTADFGTYPVQVQSYDGAQLLLSGNRNEGFRTPSQVNYVARVGRFDTEKLPYTGALKVLKKILCYEYLWQRLRVKGGAYGCMAGFGRSGEGYFCSYRDPHLKETMAVYEALPEYLRNFQVSDRDMTKYIIGAISELDTPKTCCTQSLLSLSAYYSHVTNEVLQRERDEVLSTDVASIRRLADYVEAVLQSGAVCTIGGSSAVEEASDLFGSTEALFQ